MHIGQRARKIRRAERELNVKLGREPTEEEVAEATELMLEDVIEIRKADQAPTSLDKPVGEDADTSLGELVASDQPGPAAEAVATADEEAVQRALKVLPTRERQVVRLRFGVDGEEPTPLRETGRRLGISPERVRQLEDQALKQLASNDELAALREAA